jgi:extracellular elastinolytic metalloproteinase
MGALAEAQPERGGRQQRPVVPDYDRRLSMPVPAAAPSETQTAAIAALRNELSGSLLDSIDRKSGVTRSLYNPVGKLTGSQAGAPVDIARRYVSENLALLGLEGGDLDEIDVCDVVYSATTGATHVYFCQRHQGLDVFNAQLHVNVSRDGSILSVNNSFVPGLRGRRKSRAAATEAEDAATSTAGHLGMSARRATRVGARLRSLDLSRELIEPELVWMPVGRNVKLAWRFLVHTPDGEHVYDVTVDAEPGLDRLSSDRVLTRFDRVSPGLYEVYPIPVESPSHAPIPEPADGRSFVSDPQNAVASPLGWHSTGSQSFQILRGNNVHAYDDRDANNLPPVVQPNCGPNLECSFPLDLTLDPTSYTSAAVANLFYWTNVVHDVQYLYGFDEAAGNFQVNNFGRGGLGSDAVRAEAQDGSGIDNANFTATPDGVPPRIQMFLWDFTYPLRDGDFDAGIIVHEYGHGISTRLVGGPSTVSCLSNPEQPGEGLSDWWSLVYTARPGDRGADPRGIGTYVLGSLPEGEGIRTQPYSTDPTLNDHTYESIAGMAIPHGVGEVWAQAAWEAYWMLVNLHGFDENLYDPAGGAGNQRMMLYVNEGLKNTACSPTFLNVRDGILQAAIDNYGGEDVCFLWEAFASFGLGENAVDGGPFNIPTNGFQVPAACLAGPRITNPPSGSVLSGSTVTFEWTPDQESVDEWRIDIGTSRGAADVATTGSLPGTTTTATISGLPVDGSPLFARLNYLSGGEWGFRDALYTADLATPEITSPAPGTALPGAVVTFTWDAQGLPVDNWMLDMGSTPGGTNFYTSGQLASDVLSAEVSGIPTDGRSIYVRLHYFSDGIWKSVDFAYPAADILPEMVSPVPGTTLPGADVTFTWDPRGGLFDAWTVYVGSSLGGSQFFDSGTLGAAARSVHVTGLPTDSRSIYVRLRHAYLGAWRTSDFVYTAADLSPELTAPANGSVLPGSTVAFTWVSNGAPVSNWILEVGSTPGSSNYFYSGTLAGNVLSATATGIPTDGRTIHVRLRYLLTGAWYSLSYVYTAADLVPVLTSPAPGSVLPGSTVAFAWTSNGAPVLNWILEVGSTPGASNYFYSGTLASSVLSATATGIPTDRRTIHVRLRYLLTGAWYSLSYVYTAADLVPLLTSPTPGSILPSGPVTFTWSSNGSLVNNWMLWVGTSPGASNLYYSGTLASTVTSAVVTGLPQNSSTLYARLRYLSNNVWSDLDYVFTASAPPPSMTSPLPGSTLSDTTATFTWSDGGNAATEWRLQIGSAAGGTDVYDSGSLGASVRSHEASGLPTDGRQLHARLSYRVSGVLLYVDFLYHAPLREPAMASPVPGSVLNGPNITFVWRANGADVSSWRLVVGSVPNGGDYYDSGTLPPTELSRRVTGLPTDGRSVHVRLEYVLGTETSSKNYTYTSGVGIPEVVTPAPGTVLPGPNVTFSWTSNEAPVSTWIFYVGTSPGASNLYYSGYLSPAQTSASVTNLPTDSRTIHVRLQYLLGGAWKVTDHQYTAANLRPELLTPLPGTIFSGSNVTFTWTSNGAAVQNWILYVGTSPGASNLYYSGTLASTVTTATATGLPTDSRAIHVRLRYLLTGAWQQTDYQFTAADLSPSMIAPAPGSVLQGSSATFTWTSNGAPVTNWIVEIGSSPGATNIYYSGYLASGVTSVSVSTLPTNGSPVYLRLRYLASGAWQAKVFQYTASN